MRFENMEATLIKIGNSQGLIIPKKILNSVGNSKKFDIQYKDGEIVLMPLDGKLRGNWEAQFSDAIEKGFVPEHDSDHIENEFDQQEWVW